MRVARAAVMAVLTALVSWFAVTPSNAVPEPSAPLLVYAYDGLAHTAPANDATTERGRPAEYDRGNAYEAVDPWSLGASARPDGPARPATHRYNDYNDTALLVRAAAGRATTQGLAVATHGALSSLKPSGVAAKSVALTEREVGSAMDDILGGASFLKQAKATQYTKPGGFGQANSDFDVLTRGVEVTDRGGGLRTATLSNGTKVNVRPFSLGDDITLEVVTPGNPALKIRYSE